jgi:hypothetical protein
MVPWSMAPIELPWGPRAAANKTSGPAARADLCFQPELFFFSN